MIQQALTLPKQKLTFRHDPADGWFVNGTLEQFPDHIREDVKQEYASRYLSKSGKLQSDKTSNANTYLRNALETVNTVKSPLGISPDDDNDTMTIHAQRIAAEFARIFATTCSPLVHALAELQRLEVPAPQIPHGSVKMDDGAMLVTEQMAIDLHNAGVDVDMVVVNDETYKTRRLEPHLTSPGWWLGVLGRERLRLAELQYQRLGMVHRDSAAYVSNYALAVQVGKSAMNREYMKSQEAVSLTDGRVMDMEMVMDAGVSNPANLLNEMATRVSNTEEWIQEHHPDYACLFFTFTAPSIFHRMRIVGSYKKRDKHGNVVRKIGSKVVTNPNYEMTVPFTKGRGKNAVTTQRTNTPRLSHEWIKDKWADFRTWLKDQGINSYFVRSTEPMHDSTTHWHGLLWVPESQAKAVRKAMRDAFLSEYGDEYGARKHRIMVKHLDPQDGSAAGYLMKYLSKNINGHGLADGDYESGLDAATGAERVTAWRKVWGIRAFQFSQNLAPVTVWRELRRLTEADVTDRPALAQLREAADKGNWKQYMELLPQLGSGLRKGIIDLKDGSGISNPLDWSPVGLPEPEAWAQRFYSRLSLAKTNQYGEVVPRVIGIQSGDGEAVEQPVYRESVWEIRAKDGCETWLDKLRKLSEHAASWKLAGAAELHPASSSLSAEPTLGLVKNNYGTEPPPDLMEDWQEDIRRASWADFRRSRIEPHKEGHRFIRDKYPTWEKYTADMETALQTAFGSAQPCPDYINDGIGRAM